MKWDISYNILFSSELKKNGQNNQFPNESFRMNTQNTRPFSEFNELDRGDLDWHFFPTAQR